METHDKVMLGIIIVLLLLAITFGIGYFIIYGKYTACITAKQTCIDSLNRWALNASSVTCPVK